MSLPRRAPYGILVYPGSSRGSVTFTLGPDGLLDVSSPDFAQFPEYKLSVIEPLTVEITLPEFTAVQGRVLANQDGTECVDPWADVIARSGELMAQVRTDENGDFTAYVTHGKWSFSVLDDLSDPVSKTIQVGSEPVEGLTLRCGSRKD